MSTGDQSQYLRKKMAERRISSALGPQPVFMKSGFQRWAENERPTRMGGAEKEPLEVSREGGRNILPELKKLGQQMYQKFYEQEGGAKHIEGDDENEGGRITGEITEQSELLEEEARRQRGSGYSGNGSLYQPGQAKKVKAVSNRAARMAGSGFSVQQQGQWFYVMEMEADGSVNVKAGPFKTKAEAEKAKKEGHTTLSNKQPKREKKHKKKDESSSDEEDGAQILVDMSKGKGRKSGFHSEIMPSRASLKAAEGKVEKMGSGKLECVHHEEGEGTHVKKGKGKLSEHAADLMKMSGEGKKRSSARGELVKKIMREKGLSLPMASKYVKEHNLYKG